MDWKVQAEGENAVNDSYASEKNQFEALTKREAHVLALIAENKSNAEIAAHESLALSSVKWYVNQIFSKLGVSSRGEAASRAQELGLLKDTALVRNNLPRFLTSFIGREAEIEKLLGLVRAHPLVTVTGSGGAGKTRLALKMAEKALAYFPDGVWLVELAPLADRELVPRVVLSTIGLSEMPGLANIQILSDFLRPRQALILLDNCEHVIGAAAKLAYELLRACPRLHILATSREILGAEGETAYRCPSLALPDFKQQPLFSELAHMEAVRLFCERAQNVSPGFALDEANAALAANICRSLGGIPLAIELAAARLRHLSIEQIAERLDDVFRLLTGGSRTDLPRHQTLKALIDWSYNLLSEKERHLLLRLSVFAGDWTVEAAEAVCADVSLAAEEILDLLGQLLDKSLVGMEAGTKSGQPRYSMLETICQYAHERLVESGVGAMVREKHLDYFLDLSLRADVELRGKNLRWWRELLDEEIDNLRLAVKWALNGSLEKGLRLAASLTWYFQYRASFDLTDWLQRLLAAEAEGAAEERARPERQGARGKALTTMALVGVITNIESQNLAREATAVFESLGPDYELDWALALSIWKVNDPRPLAVFRQAGDLFGVTEALWPLLMEAIWTGEMAQARIYAEESLALNHQIGYLGGEAILLIIMAYLELLEGNQERAKEYARACIDCDRTAGNNRGLGEDFLGWIALVNGDYTEARKVFTAGLTFDQPGAFPPVIAYLLGALARTAWSSGEFDLAAQYCLDAEKLSPHLSNDYLINARFANIHLAISRGEHRLAFERLKFLSEHWMIGFLCYPIQILIQVFGILAVAQDQHNRAVVLFGAQDFIAYNLMNISSPSEREEYQQALAAARAGLGEVEFVRAMTEGKALTLEEALRYAMEDQE